MLKCKHGEAQVSLGISLNLDAKILGKLKLGMSAVGDAAHDKLTSFAEHFIGTQGCDWINQAQELLIPVIDFSITIDQSLRGKFELKVGFRPACTLLAGNMMILRVKLHWVTGPYSLRLVFQVLPSISSECTQIHYPQA